MFITKDQAVSQITLEIGNVVYMVYIWPKKHENKFQNLNQFHNFRYKIPLQKHQLKVTSAEVSAKPWTTRSHFAK